MKVTLVKNKCLCYSLLLILHPSVFVAGRWVTAARPSQPVQTRLLFPLCCSSPAPSCAGCFSEGTEKLSAHLCSLGGHQLVVIKLCWPSCSPALLRATETAQKRKGSKSCPASRHSSTWRCWDHKPHPHPPSRTGRKQHGRSEPSHTC